MAGRSLAGAREVGSPEDRGRHGVVGVVRVIVLAGRRLAGARGRWRLGRGGPAAHGGLLRGAAARLDERAVDAVAVAEHLERRRLEEEVAAAAAGGPAAWRGV